MRFKERDLKEVGHFRNEKCESGYVGTEILPVFISKVKVNVQPADNRLNIEMYGNKVSEMLTLFIPCTVNVQNGDSFAIACKNPTHKVVSIKRYNTHIVALVERIK